MSVQDRARFFVLDGGGEEGGGGGRIHLFRSKFSFLSPRAVRDLNEFPTSLLSSAEDVEGCITRFTNLVRPRD